MVTNGYPLSSSKKTEILDLTSGESCKDLADFPLEWSHGVGANLNGIPVVCGGYDQVIQAWQANETCFKFTNGGFQAFASMKNTRSQPAGVIYKNKFHIFGGSGSSSSRQSSELISIDGGVEDGPDLPEEMYAHAISIFNSSVSILSGGSKSWKKTWYFNHETQTFSPGPSLLTGRKDHGSASCVDKVTEAKIFIVAGGHDGAGHISSTEMLINGIWQLGTIYCKKSNPFLIYSFDICPI